MGLYETELPLYDPTCMQKMEEEFSSLFYVDYLSEFGLPLIDVEHLRALVGRVDGNGASTSGHGGSGEP